MNNNPKASVAFLSIVSNSLLILLKIITGAMTGSIAIISEALHSGCDLLASFIAFFSVKKSSLPADSDHPFGHGKYEDMAGFLESLLIVATSAFIYFYAFQKIIVNENRVSDSHIGIFIMIISIVINIFVSKHLSSMAKKTDSIALYTDAQHLNADIYTSVAVLLALVLIKITNLHIIDPIFAIIVATLILKTGCSLVLKSFKNLIDSSLPEFEINLISSCVTNLDKNIKIASIKASKSGSNRNVQLVIELEDNISLADAHSICNELEGVISKKLKNVQIIIHPEPVKYHHFV